MGNGGGQACSDSSRQALCCDVGSVGAKKWKGMVGGGRCSLKTSDPGRNVCIEVVAGMNEFGSGGLGGPRRTNVAGRGKWGGGRGGRKWSRRGGPQARGEKWRECDGDCGQWK